jgi:protein-disulfide isomerase
MPTIVSKYVRPGKVQVESRPIAFIGPDSVSGRLAALAAAKQNRFFDFTQLVYANQGTENTGWLNDGMVKSAAASITGLDAKRLLDDRNSSTVSDRYKAMDAEATGDNVKSTPTILVGKSGTKPKLVTLSAPSDEKTVAAAIDAALG